MLNDDGLTDTWPASCARIAAAAAERLTQRRRSGSISSLLRRATLTLGASGSEVMVNKALCAPVPTATPTATPQPTITPTPTATAEPSGTWLYVPLMLQE